MFLTFKLYQKPPNWIFFDLALMPKIDIPHQIVLNYDLAESGMCNGKIGE